MKWVWPLDVVSVGAVNAELFVAVDAAVAKVVAVFGEVVVPAVPNVVMDVDVDMAMVDFAADLSTAVLHVMWTAVVSLIVALFVNSVVEALLFGDCNFGPNVVLVTESAVVVDTWLALAGPGMLEIVLAFYSIPFSLAPVFLRVPIFCALARVSFPSPVDPPML